MEEEAEVKEEMVVEVEVAYELSLDLLCNPLWSKKGDAI